MSRCAPTPEPALAGRLGAVSRRLRALQAETAGAEAGRLEAVTRSLAAGWTFQQVAGAAEISRSRAAQLGRRRAGA